MSEVSVKESDELLMCAFVFCHAFSEGGGGGGDGVVLCGRRVRRIWVMWVGPGCGGDVGGGGWRW